MKYEICIKCGKKWNVSQQAELPSTGYVCPSCRKKEKRVVLRYVDNQQTTEGTAHAEN